ncbi:MAG: hypothetical protein K2Q22_15985, partial [Cytophagales bacterium]|nr:hypothetical protein [Cytophagales bacterium]
NQLMQNPSITLPQLQEEFIVRYQIEYLIVESGAKIPEGIKNQLHLVAKDSVSGESFYLLSHP